MAHSGSGKGSSDRGTGGGSTAGGGKGTDSRGNTRGGNTRSGGRSGEDNADRITRVNAANKGKFADSSVDVEPAGPSKKTQQQALDDQSFDLGDIAEAFGFDIERQPGRFDAATGGVGDDSSRVSGFSLDPLGLALSVMSPPLGAAYKLAKATGLVEGFDQQLLSFDDGFDLGGGVSKEASGPGGFDTGSGRGDAGEAKTIRERRADDSTTAAEGKKKKTDKPKAQQQFDFFNFEPFELPEFQLLDQPKPLIASGGSNNG